MSKIKKFFNKIFNTLVRAVISSVSQDTSSIAGEAAEITPEIVQSCREAAAEGIVLLKNDNEALPLDKGRKVSVFGRVQYDYFYVGYGSGGDVKVPYKVSLMEGLANNDNINLNEELASIYRNWCNDNPVDNGYWGNWPMHYEEMPVNSELVKNAAAKSDTAIIVIGRAAGEDRENTLTKGSYYLTEDEESLLKEVTTRFSKTVVLLNIGNIFDMSWVNNYNISALVLVWQGGMESGNAVADVLSGKVTPSGKLTDTIAINYNDYPSAKDFNNKLFNNYTEDIFVGYRYFDTFAKDKVLYPFGYGLSYTNFKIDNVKAVTDKDNVKVTAKVTNVGRYSGKEILQLYYSSPQGQLGKPIMQLATFHKTALLKPKQSELIEISYPISQMASYDDSGITGNKSAYVLEEGIYNIYCGASINDVVKCGEYIQDKLKITKQLGEASAVNGEYAFDRMVATLKDNKIVYEYKKVPVATTSLKDRILNNLPKDIPYTGDKGIKLIDVKGGKATIDQFVAQLTPDELEALTRGDYVMNSPLGAKGNAGVFGGVLESLRDKGIPPITTTDGPSGIRLAACSSLLPNGTALACSWNIDLVKKLYENVGIEMIARGTDVLLAPGMNIHRNPLCGRNFEYFSEDPVVTGQIAAAVVDGLQSQGVSACIKHYACNNQEKWRTINDSRISERALREIYLKGFEICIEKSKPYNVMTSYNKINGVWGHYNYDLCTTILRGEWGYTGNVMTDWWMQPSYSPEFPNLKNQAYRVRAQVDVLMPGGKRAGRKRPDGTLLKTLGREDGITLGELQRCAMNVLNFAINSSAMKRL